MTVVDNQENFNSCACGDCPSYNQCMRGGVEKLFCGREKTSCQVASDGCICPSCSVYSANGLSDMYYCLSGKAE